MAWRRYALIGIAAALSGCAADVSRIPFDSPQHVPATQRALEQWTSETLTTFKDEEDFRGYLRAVRDLARARGEYWAFEARDRKPGDEGNITVTGSGVQPRNASITNVQEAGVDEGDIVKQIDHFLVVLQDGRLFVVDTRPAGAAGLALRDRVDVYRNPKSDAWYDEILVHGDRIVVTGYSYEEKVSEFAVFRLSPEGRLRSEGVFHVSSEDYYDHENYATRLVDGDLLFYAPVDLRELKAGGRLPWPALRRVGPGAEGRERRLLGPRDIHRPAFTTLEPTIHVVSICPLKGRAAGRDLECRSTAFIGPRGRLLYFSPDAAYLWLLPDLDEEAHLIDAARCRPGRPPLPDIVRGALYRIPHRGQRAGVVAVRGGVFDHFAMQERDGEFRALVHDYSVRCDYEAMEVDPPRLYTFFSTPVSAFGPVLRDDARSAYTPLPSPPSKEYQLADRFTDDYLVFGGLGWRRHYPDHEDQPPPQTEVVVVPVRSPASATVLTVPHNLLRAEQAGEDIVLTGHRGPEALGVSLIDLSGPPRVASTHQFEGRYESEGRSHAFNSLVGADGAGLIALPTVPLASDGDRMPSWSRPSDVDFLALDAAGQLEAAGRLDTSATAREWESGEQAQLDGEPDEDSIPGYSCEVSCVDWYGNSRPIFTDGRIFALLATELIEGRLVDGKVVEVRRIDIARSKPAR